MFHNFIWFEIYSYHILYVCVCNCKVALCKMPLLIFEQIVWFIICLIAGNIFLYIFKFIYVQHYICMYIFLNFWCSPLHFESCLNLIFLRFCKYFFLNVRTKHLWIVSVYIFFFVVYFSCTNIINISFFKVS